MTIRVVLWLLSASAVAPSPSNVEIVDQILTGKRSMTADTALRLSQYFGMSADFWMNLQSAYELDVARRQNGKAIQRIPRRIESPAGPRPSA